MAGGGGGGGVVMWLLNLKNSWDLELDFGICFWHAWNGLLATCLKCEMPSLTSLPSISLEPEL